MPDRSLTLLELHLHADGDVQFGPEVVSTGDEPAPASETRGFPVPLPVLGVMLAGVAAVALAARRARRDDPHQKDFDRTSPTR